MKVKTKIKAGLFTAATLLDNVTTAKPQLQESHGNLVFV